MSNPIFIGGLERSGKTYLRMILEGHPRLAFSHRTNLWTWHHGRYGDLSQPANLRRCLEALLESKHIHALGLDPARLERDLGAGPVTYSRLFALIHEQHAQSLGKPRWGDQTEFIEQAADAIFAVHPDARVIHMLRDPRDRYEAMRHKSRRRVGLAPATARWRTSARLALRNQARYPGRYLLLRYEELVTDPQSTLDRTCEFLGEDGYPEMLSMSAEARLANQLGGGEEGTPVPLTTKYIGSYRLGLNAREVAYIQEQVGGSMSALGYSLEPIRLSWLESLRFHLLDAAMHSLEGLGWQLRGLAKNF